MGAIVKVQYLLLAGTSLLSMATAAGALPAFTRQAECEVDECWEADLSTADDYGIYYSSGYGDAGSYPKPWVAEYRFPKAEGSETEFDPTRIGFLSFNTDPADTVQVFPTGNSSDGNPLYTFSGDYNIADNSSLATDLPTIGNGIRNKKLGMFFTATEEGSAESGFLFAYASAIPSELYKMSSSNKAEKKVVDNSLPPKRMVIRADLASRSITADEQGLAGLMWLAESSKQDLEKYGFLMSPNHPNRYPENEENLVWVYELVAEEDELIALYFLRLETEEVYDGVIVTDHASGTGLFLDGSYPAGARKVLLSTGNSVTVTFHPDSSISGTGFLAAFATIPAAARND